MAGETVERTYNAPYDRVWDALRATIWDLGYKDIQEDRGSGAITYRTGLSLSTWRGQQMTAVVSAYGASTVISLTGHQAFSPQLISYGEKRKLAEKLLTSVHYRLLQPNTGQPASQQAAVPGWYPDPNNPNLLRYFDGRAWTSATTPRG